MVLRKFCGAADEERGEGGRGTVGSSFLFLSSLSAEELLHCVGLMAGVLEKTKLEKAKEVLLKWKRPLLTFIESEGKAWHELQKKKKGTRKLLFFPQILRRNDENASYWKPVYL